MKYFQPKRKKSEIAENKAQEEKKKQAAGRDRG